jgi:hypothetical protein
MSIGRLGAVVGPALAGVLMSAGWDRPAYCLVLAAPMLIAAASLYWVRNFDTAPVSAREPVIPAAVAATRK